MTQVNAVVRETGLRTFGVGRICVAGIRLVEMKGFDP